MDVQNPLCLSEIRPYASTPSPANMATRWLHVGGIVRGWRRATGLGEGAVYRRQSDGLWVGTVELGRDHVVGDDAEPSTDGPSARRSTSSIGPTRQAPGTGTDRPTAHRRRVAGQVAHRTTRPTSAPGSMATYRPRSRVVHPTSARPDPPGQADPRGRRKDEPSHPPARLVSQHRQTRPPCPPLRTLGRRAPRSRAPQCRRHRGRTETRRPRQDRRHADRRECRCRHEAAAEQTGSVRLRPAAHARPPQGGGARVAVGKRRPRRSRARASPSSRHCPASPGEGLVVGPTKTAGSEGTIPLVEPASPPCAGTAHVRPPSGWRPTYGTDPDIVFATPIGTWTDPRNALRAWHGWTAAAGLGKRRMHASRHTCATVMLANGVPLEVVSAVLRHSSIRMTADSYARSRCRREAQGTQSRDKRITSGFAGWALEPQRSQVQILPRY